MFCIQKFQILWIKLVYREEYDISQFLAIHNNLNERAYEGYSEFRRSVSSVSKENSPSNESLEESEKSLKIQSSRQPRVSVLTFHLL